MNLPNFNYLKTRIINLKLGFIVPMFICLFFFISCDSPEQTYVSEIKELTTRVSMNGVDFTDGQWEQAIDQYKALRIQRDTTDYNFTQNDAASIDSCYRKLNEGIAKGIVNQGVNKANSYINELKNLINDVVGEGTL